MDVFISWTRADEDVKNVLVKKLQAAGLSCWDSDLHCTSDFAEECIAAIKRSSVFIAIVSEAAMEEGYVQNEITTARNQEKLGKLNILVYKITEAPYTDKFEFLLNHISFVTGNLINRVSSVAGTGSMDAIVSRAQMLLKRRKDGDPEKPFDVNVPQIEGLKLTKTGYFVEGSRDGILQAMEEGFAQSNVLVLSEFFGYGKRSTVRKYVERSGDKYGSAVMVHNTCRSLREFLTVGLKFQNVNENAFADLSPDNLLRAKFRFLEKLDDRTLLVIPDVPFEDPVDTELCQLLTGLKCHVILLTQDSAEAYADWFRVIPVSRMEDSYLQELFFHHYARAYEEEKEALTEPLSRFFAGIGGHTKTVELTAATLNRDLGVHPEDVPRYLAMDAAEGLVLKDRILRQLETVFDTERLGQDELTALLVAAYIAVPYTSEAHYRKVLARCGVEDWQTVTELDKLRWLDVDVYNRTVSMEPLVAQILFSKMPNAYSVMACCLEFLLEFGKKVVALAVSESANLQIWSKMEYFFTVTGLTECAAIMAQLRLHEIEGDAYDSQKMAKAITAFEMKYPTQRTTNIFEGEEEAEENDADLFMRQALNFVRSTLPAAKLVARNMEKLMLDFSAESNRVLNGCGGEFDAAALLGMSREMFEELLTVFREEMEADAPDEDSVESALLLECIATVDAFYKRDYPAVQAGICNLLAGVSNLPPERINADSMDTVFTVFMLVCRMYLASGIYPPVITLCQKMLQLSATVQNRLTALTMYVQVLRLGQQYTPELYEAYSELLANYDKVTRDVFDLRADMFREKKEILLMYAEDLAKGERLDEALAQFGLARKLQALVDKEVLCAQCIVDVLVKTGDFQQALEFIDRFFPAQVQAELSEKGDQQTKKILEEFTVYQSVGALEESAFAEDADPRKHSSYYQAFSRKNNSLLEQKYFGVADQALDFDFSDLSDEELAQQAEKLKKRAQKEKMLRLAPEAFALASEAGFRVLGYRHHMVQYMGAAAMAEGKIAEILNGEGKTYTILLTAFLHSLYGKRVYVIDRSDYLTARNYQWMRGVYDLLGISNGHAAKSESLAKMGQNVIYTDLHTLIFGFLTYERSGDCKRKDFPMDTVIIDEADTTLVDEAAQEFRAVTTEKTAHLLPRVQRAWAFADMLPDGEEYYTYSAGRVILQTPIYPRIEKFFRVSYSDMDRLEEIRAIENCVTTAILCHVFYEKDRDYYIKNDMPVWENKNKGVFEGFGPEMTYYLCRENGLNTQHAERLLAVRSKVNNCIHLRDFFKRFRCVCGTTATAVSFREEFRDIYGLDYFCVPPHSPVVREDLQSPVYITLRAKEQAIMELVQQKAETRQPLLIITQSTEESERYSRLLKRRGIEHKLLNAKNAESFDHVIVGAGVPGSVLVTNALAGRGADIKLGGNPELMTRQELVEQGEDITQLDSFVYTLPTQAQTETALYRKYYSILEKNKALCAADRQAVVDAGGLCVIGTSFFPEPRTEQQTRGRAGRQGDVGESWVFRSLEDAQLQPLLPPAMIGWLQDNVIGTSDITELDSPALKKTIQRSQKMLHKAHFAEVRRVNNDNQYIDKAREAFIGMRFDLTDGLMEVEDALRQWAENKTVLQQLQLLQKGEETCSIEVLQYLYKTYPQLHTVRSGRASGVLLSAIQTEMAHNLKGMDYNDPKFASLLGLSILNAWSQYIEVVYNTVGRVNMTAQAMEQFLTGEKQRLLRWPVEQLIRTRLK